mgnify:CR=1 FL=1
MVENETLEFRNELERASEWLRKLLIDHVGEDCNFDTLLGRELPGNHPEYAQNIFELDRIKLLQDIVHYLVTTLGNEEQAFLWLFHNKAFKAAGCADPYDYLQDGSFDALWLLRDLLCMRASATPIGPGNGELLPLAQAN